MAASAVARAIAGHLSDEKVVEELYLSAFSRYPTDAEKTRVLSTMAGPKDADRREVIEDLYWGVLSSKEFLFNH